MKLMLPGLHLLNCLPVVVDCIQVRPGSPIPADNALNKSRLKESHFVSRSFIYGEATRWSDGDLYYQFHVSPIIPAEVAEFEKAIQTKSQPLGFSINLGDSDGFKLCTIRIYDADLLRDLDESGKTQGLSANGTGFCSSANTTEQASGASVGNIFPKCIVTDATR